MKLRNIALAAISVCLVATALWWLGRDKSDGRGPEVLIPLNELPGIFPETLDAQGKLFRIEEPLLYNPTTKMGVFVTEILSSKNFDDETHVVIGGDAKSLECFGNEIRFVNAGPSSASAVGGGAVDGVKSLAEGLWHLVRHPLHSVEGLGSGIKNASIYMWNTKAGDMKDDAAQLAKAFYYDKASETAEAHKLDYFDVKTAHGKAALEREVNAELAGRGAMELALFLVPFSKVKVVGEGAEAAKAATAAEAVGMAEKMAEAGKLPADAVEIAKAGRFFPKMVEKMTATLKRLKSAAKTEKFNPPVATLGKAVSTDYRATFLAANKEIEAASVVVHHAVEQQALTRYPGVVTETEMHSLENLRGIPKSLDTTLHKTEIAMEWNEFYRLNPAAGMTKEKLLQKATEIDRKFGHLFTPKRL